MDYETEEESKTSMSPRMCVEVLGVSEWDGRGRATNYNFGFLIVTHTGSTYYVSVPTMQERDEWVLQLKRCLECVFANPEVVPFKPSKILSSRPPLGTNSICPATKNIVNRASAVHCRCCGLGYYASEHVNESSTVLQISVEEAEKVCLNCRNAQAVVLWLKSLNYIHTIALHESTKAVLQEVHKFKASFKLRRRLSARLELAADLLEEGKLTAEEFEELRVVDHSYRRELLYEESIKLKGAVDAFGDDMQTIIDVILNSSLIDKGGRWSQASIILKVLEVADRAPDIVDFYMPQLLQAHLIISEGRTVDALVKLDLFQQALLVMAQKYPALGLKLCWGLVATVGDYAEKRVTQVQYAACVGLLLQLEMVTTGYVSSICDVPLCKQLGGALIGPMHQQQEVGYELGALFLVRRRLQEVNDEEELDRKIRRGIIDPDLVDANGKLLAPLPPDVLPVRKAGPLIPSETSCIDLLYQLGVGQAGRSRRFSDDDSDNNTSEDDEEEDKGDEESGKQQKSNSSSSSHGEPTDNSNHSNKNSTVNNTNGESVEVEKKGGRRQSGRRYKEAAHQYLGFQNFAEQLDFINKLNVVVECLRFIDRPLRTKCLLKEVAKWNEQPLQELGWDPTTIAGEPFYRIMHIVASECRVFRTKARAPSMIVCEVLRDDLVPYYLDSLKHIGAGIHNFSEGIDRTAHGFGKTGAESANGNRRSEGTSPRAGAPSLTSAELAALNSGSVRRSTHNPIFINNVDAQTIDASAQDVVIEQHDRASDPARLSLSQEVVVAGSSLEGFHAHDISTVYAASEKLSELKAVHAEREKFETVSRNIDNVVGIISSTGKFSSVPPPVPTKEQVKEKEPAAPQETTGRFSPALKRGGSIPRESSLNSLPVHLSSSLPNMEADDSPTVSAARTGAGSSNSTGKVFTSHTDAGDATGRDSIGEYSHASSSSNARAPIMRKATRSVLASNRLSVKSVQDITRHTGVVPPSMSTHVAAANKSEKPSPQMTMSASGVFSPAPGTPTNPTNGGQVPRSLSRSGDGSSAFVDRDSVADGEEFGQFDAHNDNTESQDSGSMNSGSNNGTGASQVTKKVLSSAQRLLAAGLIDPAEYELLIASDQNFQDETAREEAVIARHRVEDAFGESWEAKKERILGDRLYMFGYPSEDVWPSWDLRSFIAKSNDDLRQEVCCLQLMQLFKEIFEHFGLQNCLYLKPYRIISTGNSTGLVQVLSDAMSLDALKKTEGFTTLSAYFQKTYDSSAERYNQARMNFASSLAAYSLFSYLLLIKDRHNGNLMIDAEGHILHIDFGFLLSIAPGGSFSLESAPFKLTEEMVEVLGGLDSPLFGEFLTAFTKGFIALQSNAENIVSALQILSYNSSYPCFQGKQASLIIEKLRGRFRTELSVTDAVKHCLDLITNSYGHYGTRQYDTFQWMTNGIMP